MTPPARRETHEDAHQAYTLMAAALDRLKVLSIDMDPFRDIGNSAVFEAEAGAEDLDGWDKTGLTPAGETALVRARRSAVDAARATRVLVYDSRSTPEGWGDAMRRCLELTFMLVAALKALEQNSGIEGFFSKGEILTEFVQPVREACKALAAARDEHSLFPSEEAVAS